MGEQTCAKDSPELEQFEELIDFATLVAQTALSFVADGKEAAPSLLEQIVAGAVRVIPGTAAAAVEDLDENGWLKAPVSEGDGIARSVMQAQNETGQGPCLEVVQNSKQLVIHDMEADPRWPLFTARAVQLGIRSMICTPIEAGGRRLGVLSLMSRTTEFSTDEDTPALAAVFAAHAGVAMIGARRLADVNAALTNRDVIGQAKGILMERFKIAPDVAFAMLIRTSSVTNLKLREVCNQLCLTGVLLTNAPRLPRNR